MSMTSPMVSKAILHALLPVPLDGFPQVLYVLMFTDVNMTNMMLRNRASILSDVKILTGMSMNIKEMNRPVPTPISAMFNTFRASILLLFI